MSNEDFTAEKAAEIEGLPFNEAVGKLLGKEFPDAVSAGKALLDTQHYVAESAEGRKAVAQVMQEKGFKSPKEAVDYIMSTLKPPAPTPPAPTPPQSDKPAIDPNEFVSKKEFEKTQFYGDKPEFKAHQELVEMFVAANPGKTREEIVGTDAFKKLYEPLRDAKQKSVLHSDSKIGIAEEGIDKAQKQLQEGDIAGAGKTAVETVMNAFKI